jgi:CPA1 family monovalent cation:H+ antiporter
VIGGLVLGLVPGIPDIHLNPDLVLLVFLPPLLYASAFFADLRSLRTDARVITINAIGMTLATAAVVGVIAHEMIGLPWAMSFALGAIVSPTDPAAATAVMRRVGAPRRIVNVLEGESLVNDATALVFYKVAVAVAIGESVSAGHTVLTFFGDVAGGVAIGIAVGWAIAEIRKRITDVNTELTISLFSAYGAFVPADQLGVSGVLAVVACGLVLGFRAPEIASPESRMQGYAMWSILTFLLNATLFILIGLQLPVIVDGLSGRPAGEVVGYAAAVCAAVIAMRFIWINVMTVVIRTLDRRPSQRARRSTWRVRVLSGWSGMRGAVSLAAALALPLHTHSGEPLPGRALIQFITFALILVTVVGEGLTLPWLIRRLGLVEDGTEEENEEIRARLVIARAAIERVDELEAEDWTREGTIERVRRLYEFRQRRFKIRSGKIEDEDGLEEGSLAYQRLMHEIYSAQRQALVGLRNRREISAEVMRRVEHELDLEETRLEV